MKYKQLYEKREKLIIQLKSELIVLKQKNFNLSKLSNFREESLLKLKNEIGTNNDLSQTKLLEIKLDRDKVKLERSKSNILAEKYKLEHLRLLKQESQLGFNQGDFIYLEYKKKDLKHYTLCFVVKESISHLKVVVYDRKRNSAHKYLIKKDDIDRIKHYDGEDQSAIMYNDLMDLWGNNSHDSN